MPMTKSWMKLRDDMLANLPQVVSVWRRVADELDLVPVRISWIGPIERVAFRVLDEAKRHGWKVDQVRAVAIKLAGPARVTVDSASVDRTGARIAVMLRLGEAAKAALTAQATLVSDLPTSAVRGQIEAAFAELQAAEVALSGL